MYNASPQQFFFKKLPQVKRSELHFFDTLASVLPPSLVSEDFINDLVESVQKYVHAPIDWSWTNQDRFLDANQLSRYCIQPNLLAQLALLPFESRVLIEFDPRISEMMVDRALGGSESSGTVSRSLSEIEKGVFTFLFLKVLNKVQQSWAAQAQVEFRLDGLSDSLDDLRAPLDPEDLYYRKEIRIQFQQQHGFLRIYTPVSLIQEILGRTQTTPAQEFEYLRQQLHRVAEVPLSGSVRVGVVELSEADFAGIEEDDIILLRECTASRQENGLLEGMATLQFGEDSTYGVRCAILDQSSPAQSLIRIEEVLQIAEPPVNGAVDRSEYEMDDNQNYPSEYEDEGYGAESGENEEENLEQMGPVLSDVPVPLVVEMGRIECKARDIMYLRMGQVLELRRSPYEPLNLVVNGQLLGRGELVEIEGQLGVRITELLK